MCARVRPYKLLLLLFLYIYLYSIVVYIRQNSLSLYTGNKRFGGRRNTHRGARVRVTVFRRNRAYGYDENRREDEDNDDRRPLVRHRPKHRKPIAPPAIPLALYPLSLFATIKKKNSVRWALIFPNTHTHGRKIIIITIYYFFFFLKNLHT